MRVLVCGDRNWNDYDTLYDALKQVSEWIGISCIIEGDARGADRMGGEYASLHEIPLEVYPADWNTHGKAAGPIRNKQMLDEGKPELVLAFHKNLQSSKGTLNMIFQANKAGIPVRLFSN